jgi:hypothetical protein
VVVVVMVGVSNTRMLLQTRQWYYYFAAEDLGFGIYLRDLNAYITFSTHETWRIRCRKESCAKPFVAVLLRGCPS